MKGAEETKLILAQALDFHPADLLHAIQYRPQIVRVMHLNLSQQRRVAVECEMRQGRHQKILAEDEFFDGPALIGRVINHDVGEHGDARQRIGNGFRVLRLEIKKLALVANQDEAERRKVVGIFVKSRAGKSGEFRLIIRAEMAAAFKVVKNTRQMRKLVHLEVRARGEPVISPSAVV